MIKITTLAEFQSTNIPQNPGCYIFRDKENKILYIGKAKNLRSRVRNYFTNYTTTTDNIPLKTKHLVSKINTIDWIIVDNEIEALLLENKLIKQHTPKYNISLKDSKTYAYIALTKEKYPRLLTARKPNPKLELFGPYTDGTMRRDLQRLVTKIFKIRTCKTLPKKACLNYYIGLCTAPCIQNATEEEYTKQVQQAREFLNGNFTETIEQLKKYMQQASIQQKYEKALEIKNQIESIQLLTQKQKVDNIKNYDQDIIAFRRHGEKTLIVHMSVRKGVLLGKKEYTLELQDNLEEEFIKAYYSTNEIPREILTNKEFWTDTDEKNTLETYLSAQRCGPVNITIPMRAEKAALMKLAEKNIEANLDEDTALVDLQTELNLPAIPTTIECFDISNLGQEHIVSGMTRFVDAKPDKKGYRKFKMKTVKATDDFASIHEVVYRRYFRLKEEKQEMPNLIVIDGGLGQLNAALHALKELGLTIPIISLAKKLEEIYIPGEEETLQFNKNSRMMLLLRQIRDATHNFSIGYNKKRRQMKMKEEFDTNTR